METTLVTGATGLVGYNIIAALIRRGRPVRALVRSVEKARQVLPEQCELFEGDITDKESFKLAMQGCSVVYHAAGIPEQWLPNPGTFQRVNVGGTQNAIDAALEQGVRRFVFTSTADVFYAPLGQEFDESTLDPRPLGTHYERSKQDADRRVADALQKGLPAIFLHPAGVYGPGSADSPGNVLIMKLQRRQIPGLPPGGGTVVFAPDVGEGHVLAEERAAPGSRYILSDAYYEVSEQVRLTLEALGMDQRPPPDLPLPLVQGFSILGEWLARFTHRPPALPRGQLYFVQLRRHACSDKARQELGWSSTPFRVGLQKTIEFLIK
jgi:nucleoside-diphosphate-sugar epimerase